MLTHPTIDLLRALKLDGMADAFLELEAQDRAKDLGHAEWLALLIDREAACRSTKRFRSRLKSARLRHGQASVEDVDYRAQRRLDKALFQQLATCRWIADHRSLLVTGPCGVGKSWLSCALWDAWHTLQPEQQGTWRSTLLAALVICARGKTRHLLLPIDTGQRLSRKRWDRRDDNPKRMLAFFEMAACAVQAAGKELDSLNSATERMGLKIKSARKNSRLPALVDLMVAKPLVSIPLASKELRISKQALRVMIPRLGSTPREITERNRYRCWTVT